MLHEFDAEIGAWFYEHMSSADGSFGLMLDNGSLAHISKIKGISRASDGSIWLDVLLANKPADDSKLRQMQPGGFILWSIGAETTASINAAHIVAAFELPGS